MVQNQPNKDLKGILHNVYSFLFSLKILEKIDDEFVENVFVTWMMSE